jgi:hypothetical protein
MMHKASLKLLILGLFLTVVLGHDSCPLVLSEHTQILTGIN